MSSLFRAAGGCVKDNMTAADVRTRLQLRWPDEEYLTIAEAPESSDRMGRKIDLLIVSLWRSRGLELDAVEIKVSTSDWKRELEKASKADFWWRHSNRFWIAAPADICAKIQPDLPIGWGLLACKAEGAPKIIVKPERHDNEDLTWSTCIGLMRAAADAGHAALRRAEQRGRSAGIEAGKRQIEQMSPDTLATKALEDLRDRVAAFEGASGICLSGRDAYDAEHVRRVGELVNLVRKDIQNPGQAVRAMESAVRILAGDANLIAENARRAAESVERFRTILAAPHDPAEKVNT
jgi:hypothetical protein